MGPTRPRSASRPKRTASPSTRSSRSRCSIRTSTTKRVWETREKAPRRAAPFTFDRRVNRLLLNERGSRDTARIRNSGNRRKRRALVFLIADDVELLIVLEVPVRGGKSAERGSGDSIRNRHRRRRRAVLVDLDIVGSKVGNVHHVFRTERDVDRSRQPGEAGVLRGRRTFGNLVDGVV